MHRRFAIAAAALAAIFTGALPVAGRIIPLVRSRWWCRFPPAAATTQWRASFPRRCPARSASRSWWRRGTPNSRLRRACRQAVPLCRSARISTRASTWPEFGDLCRDRRLFSQVGEDHVASTSSGNRSAADGYDPPDRGPLTSRRLGGLFGIFTRFPIPGLHLLYHDWLCAAMAETLAHDTTPDATLPRPHLPLA